jgi:Recombination endonuclease VII
MKLMGSKPGPNGRFVKGGKSYGGPGRKPGACMIGDRPLTAAERQRRHNAKRGAAAAYAAKRKWEKANPEKHRASKRRQMLKKYGLTPESYESRWKLQGKKCAVCKRGDPGSSKGWQVDHCHVTNLVRGIVCTHCNRMIAGALDNPKNLIEGIRYLQKFVCDSSVRAA